MLTRMIVFMCLGTLVLFGLHYYVYARLVRYLTLGVSEQRLLKLLLGTLFSLLWLSMPFSRLLRLPLIQPLLYAMYVWLGVLILSAVVLASGDLLRLFMASTAKLQSPDIDRRAFFERMLGWGSLGFTGALTVVGLLREFLGAGTLFAQASNLLGPSFAFLEMKLPGYGGALLMILPPGGFALLGFLLAGKRAMERRAEARASARGRGLATPSAA